MPEGNQATSQGSPPASQGQSATSTGWEAEKARLEAELQSTRKSVQELSKYRAGLEQVVRDSEGVVTYDPSSGQVGWNLRQGQQAPPAYSGANPWAGLVEDPTQVDGWLTSRLSQAGYMTRQQAEDLSRQYANQAYQSARGDFVVLRSVDRTLSNPKYKDLGSYGESDLSKRTERILTEKNLGRPLDGAKSWESWQYAAPDSLQQAADLARLEIYEASQAAQAASQQGQAAQQAAGLSVGQPGSGTPPGPQSFEDLSRQGKEPSWDDLRDQFKRNAEAMGVVTP